MGGPLQLSSFGMDSWPIGEFDWQGSVNATDALRTSLEHDLSVFDTAPVYTNGRSESLFGAFFERTNRTDEFFVATKVGLEADATGDFIANGRPDFLRDQLQSSLRRLNRESVDLVQLHVRDPDVPLVESVGALTEMVDRGYADYTGFVLSDIEKLAVNKRPETDFVRVPFSIFDYFRHGDELIQNLLENYRVLAYDPLCGGLFSQHYADINEEILDHEVREHHPKFTTNRVNYVRCLREIQEFFLDQGWDELHLESVGLAWLKQKYNFDSILFGVRSSNDIAHIKAARELELTDEDCSVIETIVEKTVAESEPPYFVQPPPALPRHSFEHHVLNESVRKSFAKPSEAKV